MFLGPEEPPEPGRADPRGGVPLRQEQHGPGVDLMNLHFSRKKFLDKLLGINLI
jgi:hypothetical protein